MLANWSLIVPPVTIALEANNAIAVPESWVLSEMEANSAANSPENWTAVPNCLLRVLWAATTSLLLTIMSPNSAAASVEDLTKLLPSTAETPISLAISPAVLSINWKA